MGSTGKKIYITDDERRECRKIAAVFAEMCDENDSLLLEAGRFGFVRLQYYRFGGFDALAVFTKSSEMFENLWEEWLETQLCRLSRGTTMENMDFGEIFECLPEEKRKELMDKKKYFEEKVR